MTSGRRLLLVAAASVATVAAVLILRPATPAEAPRLAVVDPALPRPPSIEASQIAGRLPMEKLPVEIGKALEAHSEEIVRTAEALEGKQARITGICAPGSAIRVIAEDGTVSCQRLPKGIASVSALTGIPRRSTTVTAPIGVPGGVGRYQTAGDDDYLVVPIALPDGAIVTSFSFAAYDASAEVDASAYLYRSDDQPLATVKTEGASRQVRTVATDEIHHKKVDAAHYAYFVYFQLSAQAGPDLVPVSASVSYRLP